MFVRISEEEAQAIGTLTVAGIEIVDSKSWPTGNGAFWVNITETDIIKEKTGIDLTGRLVYTQEEARDATTFLF